ncbi:hypothetical protein [Crocosphaera chwakensis]|uniref:Uncharacterized protein n=1 Tax=Crocosphaera chwakensis CCY0110 TaxID=391612 RepID=A3IXL1_9CHRO|nr:hypothetical protein [Crocosphaera chwakensis]EAZ88767.1 hypothetical protein CY0110_09365 [Crocosphaera chwakensis CCY0110]
MIKLSIKIIIIASLTVGLGGYFIPKKGFSFPSHNIKSIKVEKNTIPVALPYNARVTLKTNSTISGKIINFDPQQSNITVDRSGRSKTIKITDIEKVEFGKEVKLIHSEKPVIRGEDNNFNPNTAQNWQEPLTNFKITNAQDGKAEVILSNISRGKLRGIRAVSQTNTYVVDELSFNDNNNYIILTVIPYSE